MITFPLMIADAPMETPDCSVKKASKTRPKRSNMYGEARELQELVLKHSRAKGLKPFLACNLVRAYREMAELRLRLQGKGPPKAVDYASKKPKTKASQGFTETPVEKIKAKAPKTDTTTDSGPT